jgi:nitroimidazol reductase NimA-like FMN-containing flavoprotein (pyridoxamine 5'-phosphate oxidase superfamily)
LDLHECERLLRAGTVGRVAISTPEGPHITSVSYRVLEDTIVLRTSSYSVLGTYGRNTMLAFEVDHVEPDGNVRWSVVARGRGWVEVDHDELARIREGWQPRRATSGSRSIYLRIRWDSLIGCILGDEENRAAESSVHRTLTAL